MSRCPRGYRALTWSWASLDEAGRYQSIVWGPETVHLDILECVVEPQSPLHPLGDASRGRLTVRGFLKPLLRIVPGSSYSSSEAVTSTNAIVADGDEHIFDGDLDNILSWKHQKRSFFCLRVASYLWEGVGSITATTNYLLVLQATDKEAEYERVGIGAIICCDELELEG
jgi:hypothetical protein